jgi:hypothetical protein
MHIRKKKPRRKRNSRKSFQDSRPLEDPTDFWKHTKTATGKATLWI